MLRLKLLRSLLQVLIVFNNAIPNSGETLHMKWESFENQNFIKATADSVRILNVINSEVFHYLKLQTKEKLVVHEFARSTLEQSFVVALCSIHNTDDKSPSPGKSIDVATPGPGGTSLAPVGTIIAPNSANPTMGTEVGSGGPESTSPAAGVKAAFTSAESTNTGPAVTKTSPKSPCHDGSLFYVMVTCPVTPSSGGVKTKIVLNWIGGILKVDDINSNENKNKVKYSAELHVQGYYAFQSVWQPSETYEKNSGLIKNCVMPGIMLPTRSGEIVLLNFARYWIVTEDKEMVALYANEEVSKGAYLTVAINSTLDPPKYEVIHYELVETSFVETFDALHKHLNTGLAFYKGWNLVSLKNMEIFSEAIKQNLRRDVPWLQENLVLEFFAQSEETNGLFGTIFKTSGTYEKNTLFAIWDVNRKDLVHVSVPGTLKQTLSSYRSYSQTGYWEKIRSYEQGVGWWQHEGTDHFTHNHATYIENGIKKAYSQLAQCTILRYGIMPNPVDVSYKSTQNICVIFKCPDGTDRPAMITLETNRNDPTEIRVEDIILEHNEVSTALVVNKMVIARYSHSLAWTLKGPPGFNISLIETFLQSTSNISESSAIYFSQNVEKLLVIVKIKTRNGSHQVCFVALKNSDNYAVTWVGRLWPGGNLTCINNSKQEAAIYNYESTFAYNVVWETGPGITNPATPLHYTWELPDKKHKIEIFRRVTDEGPSKLWYIPSVKPNEYAEYVAGLPGGEYEWIGDALAELSLNIDNPLLYSERFCKRDMPIHLKGVTIQNAVDLVGSKYGRNVQYLFETLIFPNRDRTKAVLVFNYESNAKLRMTNYPAGQTPNSSRHILVPMSAVNCPNVGPTLEREGEMLEIIGDWRLLFKTHVRDPFFRTAEAIWVKSMDKFEEREEKIILDNAPWKTKASGFTTEKVKKIDWVRTDATFYICYLKIDLNPKFLLVWNHDEEDLFKKLRYIGGLGTIQDVQNDYARYISSALAFEEIGFRNGIARYDKQSEPVKKLVEVVLEFLKKECLNNQDSANISEVFEYYQFGRISTRIEARIDDVFTYCFYGKMKRGTDVAVYATFLIQVKETMNGINCLSFETGKAHRSILQTENALAKFITQYHMYQKN